MNNLKCLFGFHQKNLIMKQRTNEVDDSSRTHLKRNVYCCEKCGKKIYKRTDHIIGIIDKNWTWLTTDYI